MPPPGLEALLGADTRAAPRLPAAPPARDPLGGGAGAAGATAKAIAVELHHRDPKTWGRDPRRAHKAVLAVVKRLVDARALRDTEQTVTPRTGGPPAAIYVATGIDQAADAVAQAEALLRRARPGAARPSPGGAGEEAEP